MMARFWILQRGVHSLDISETDDAMPNHKLEAHLLYKATQMGDRGIKDMSKTSLACRLHQQQLIEVLLLSVSGLWVLSRLFSFSQLMSTGGLMPRMSKALKTLASAVNVRRGQPCDYSTTFRNEVRE